MIATLGGITTDVNPLSLKTLHPITVTDDGIAILTKLVHESNAA
jgi:hypothetical protein